MAGYGMELALKKTDYLVVDDRDTGSGSSSDSQIQPSNTTLASGTFEDILGSDPWAELSTPLSKFEVMGKSPRQSRS
jgi:UDP-glucose:glycoprotein glucosyltransferase